MSNSLIEIQGNHSKIIREGMKKSKRKLVYLVAFFVILSDEMVVSLNRIGANNFDFI